jgi:hypothetical protein
MGWEDTILKTQIGARPVVQFSRIFTFGRALTASLLLLVVTSQVPALAQDGAKAAATAKEAAENMGAYLRDLEKSGHQPDYSKPPASEYLKLIFNADALAALASPKTEDVVWLADWTTPTAQTYQAMVMFGAKDPTDQTVGRNMIDYQSYIFPAAAFVLRLNARAVSTMVLLPPDRRASEEIGQSNWGLVQMATGMVGLIRIHLKPENVRLTAAALRDTVSVWAPLATPKERAELLSRLETARAKNGDAGIDGDIIAVSTAIKNVKE